MFCSFLLSAVLTRMAKQTQMQIWWHYVDEEAYYEAVEKEGSSYIADLPRPDPYEMTHADHFVQNFVIFYKPMLYCSCLWPEAAGRFSSFTRTN